MSDNWAPGDLALCVNATPHPFMGTGGLRAGAIYTVAAVCPVFPNIVMGTGPGLQFVELTTPLAGGFSARRFRKINPLTDEERRYAERELRNLPGKPVKEGV